MKRKLEITNALVPLKKGFTLAEVLITLGIIGVVAAMTIPTLMANIKGSQYKAQFKKSLSTLNQMVRMNKAKYDFDFADTNASCLDSFDDTPETKTTFCAIFNGNLSGYTRLNYTVGGKDSDADYKISLPLLAPDCEFDFGGSGYGYSLADGSFVYTMDPAECYMETGKTLQESIDETRENSTFLVCVGFIDVNGLTLPNKEIQCSGDVETKFEPEKPCIVKAKDMTDIFPVVFHDATVEPATNASKYVLNTAK